MSTETTMLQVEKREKLGSRYCRRLRASGKLPAVVYGHKQDPVAVTLDAKDAITHISKGEKLFTLELDGKSEHVLLKDLGYDYLGTNIIHADLTRVNLDERVDTRAHIRLVGDAIGLKSAGAILMNPLQVLELNCVVTNLPDEIEVDISALDIGDAVHARDVKLPKSTMVLLTDEDAVIAQIIMAKAEEVDEAAVVADGAEPTRVDEKKPEGETA
ncbi:MAG: large subunit ribosomal protein L25 [Phycisphaerales bacterium]|jgi:large subunit ribosomal protein L25